MERNWIPPESHGPADVGTDEDLQERSSGDEFVAEHLRPEGAGEVERQQPGESRPM